jgi:hypothetical protein
VPVVSLSVRRWLQVATSGPVVRRALKFAVVVGAILITINHGDAIVAGEIDSTRLAKMMLTVFVPYAVSTASSVAAILERESGQA